MPKAVYANVEKWNVTEIVVWSEVVFQQRVVRNKKQLKSDKNFQDRKLKVRLSFQLKFSNFFTIEITKLTALNVANNYANEHFITFTKLS